jgi:hypothetical protein
MHIQFNLAPVFFVFFKSIEIVGQIDLYNLRTLDNLIFFKKIPPDASITASDCHVEAYL